MAQRALVTSHYLFALATTLWQTTPHPFPPTRNAIMRRTYKESTRLVHGHSAGITTVAFSPKGDLLATAGMDGKVCFWRVQGGKLLHCHMGNCPVLSVAWLPTAEYSVMCGTKEGNIIMITITSTLVCPQPFWC